MSRNISFFSIFSLVFCLAFCGTTPVFAGGGNGVGQSLGFDVVGLTGVKVNAAGGLMGIEPGPLACPFGGDGNKFKTAADAAKAAGEPDGCPYAVSNTGEKIYFKSCLGFYKTNAEKLSSTQAPDANVNVMCCHLSPVPLTPGGVSARKECQQSFKEADDSAKASVGGMMKADGVVPDQPGYVAPEDAKKMAENQNAIDEANRQCINGALDRIDQYWGKKRSVACIKTVTKMISDLMKTNVRELKDKMLARITTGTSSTQPFGTSPGATLGIPSFTGLAQSALAAANFATAVLSTAKEASDFMNDLSKDCGGIVPQLQEINQWRQTVLGANVCQGVMNIVERQLTQCVRVNLDVSSALKLPQFKLLTQCPISINVGAVLTPNGFDCYADAGTGVQASYNGKSLLSGNGGLENLFNDKCFGTSSNSNGGGGNTNGTGTHTPGVDCGPLDNNQLKQVALKGQIWLTPGHATNGWAVGGSEQNNGLTITRCDLYDNSKVVRTAYVYGSGSSCNAGANGFMDGGYETNTSCYAGGYTPAATPSVPDACLYNAACLDAGGKVDPAKIGTGNCPAFQAPKDIDGDGALNKSEQLNGVSPGLIMTNMYGDAHNSPCTDFDPNTATPVMCCDPQKQDCTQKDANTPLCQCDQGDASNTVSNTQTGQCLNGGKQTCCSPRLNGGVDGCTSLGYGDTGICKDEQNLCVDPKGAGSYTGPDGRSQPLSNQSLANSKPSPYIYLFIRPDAQMNGQQCCTTEWCNVCPQHYANAYGLALQRATPAAGLKMAGDLGDTQYDHFNNDLLGRGWPFQEYDNDNNVTSYAFGKDVLIQWTEDKWNPFLGFKQRHKYKIRGNEMPLYLNENLKMPVSLETCSVTTHLATMKKNSEIISSGMGFVGGPIDVDNDKDNKASSKDQKIGMVPDPGEYPLDHMNQIRMGMTDSTGTPLPAIPLCSEIKLCIPPTQNGQHPQVVPNNGTGIIGAGVGMPTVGAFTLDKGGQIGVTLSGSVVSTGTTTTTPTTTPSAGTTTTTTTPVTSSPGVGTTMTPSASSGGVTSVPSAGASTSSSSSSSAPSATPGLY